MLVTVNGILRDQGLMLRAGTVVDATLTPPLSSTQNASGARDPQMKQAKKQQLALRYEGAHRRRRLGWLLLLRVVGLLPAHTASVDVHWLEGRCPTTLKTNAEVRDRPLGGAAKWITGRDGGAPPMSQPDKGNRTSSGHATPLDDQVPYSWPASSSIGTRGSA